VAKQRRYLLSFSVPKMYFRLLQELANKLGIPLEQLVEQALQEYIVNYVIPVVQHVKR